MVVDKRTEFYFYNTRPVGKKIAVLQHECCYKFVHQGARAYSNRTIRWQTNSASVKSRTGQLADSQLAEMFDL